MQFPTLAPWMKTLLAGLLGAYVLELVAAYIGFDTHRLGWSPLGAGFAPWQPVTRFLVQGDSVVGVLVGLLVLSFVLPALEQTVDRTVWTRGLMASLLASTVVPLPLDAVGALGGGPAMGWGVGVVGLFVIFGLALPDAVVKLFFVLDVPARSLVWISLALLAVGLVVSPSLSTASHLGAWVGAAGWWHGLGPGRRRRELLSRKDEIQKELRRFEVIEGGRAHEPPARGPRSGNRPDDLVH